MTNLERMQDAKLELDVARRTIVGYLRSLPAAWRTPELQALLKADELAYERFKLAVENEVYS
jgi:hypothetical protein